MKPIPLALPWWRGMYPHEKTDKLAPFLRLDFDKEDWYCCDCHREGRVLKVTSGGAIRCAKCNSPFLVTLKENDAYQNQNLLRP